MEVNFVPTTSEECMPKYRQIHIKILESDDFNDMPDDFTRLVWVLLPCVLDREGRGKNNIQWMKSKMFPQRKDIDDNKLADAFSWFINHDMIVLYVAENKPLFYIPTWKKYQTGTEREAPSILPGPEPEITQELLATNSGVTHELLTTNSAPLVVDVDIVNAIDIEESLTKKTFFSIREAEKAYMQVTGFVTVPGGMFEYLEKILDLLNHYGWEDTLARLTDSKDDWVKHRRKDNGATYRLTNPKWIDNAIAGETLSPKKVTEEERSKLEQDTWKLKL